MLDIHQPRPLPAVSASTNPQPLDYSLPSYNFRFEWSPRAANSVKELQSLRLQETPSRRLSPPLFSLGRDTPQSFKAGGQSSYVARPTTPDMSNTGGTQSMPDFSRYDGFSNSVAPSLYPAHYVPKIGGIVSRPSSRPESPVFEPNEPPSRRGSTQSGGIVSYLQIPATISSSRGSLAEFAAQITCLFWFESSATLSSIEDSETSPMPTSRLASEAIPTTGFLKWVTTILSTTQVTQNVILLALLFVYRLKTQNPTVKGKPGSEYRLLTVALMLGNKFLDDNTYTNKTWAEVSGISVTEIHVMEVEFLSHMKYNLYTSKEAWKKWHKLLSRFFAYFDRASRKLHEPLPRIQALRPPTLQIPPSLPSPPASTNHSPPYGSSAISPTSTPFSSVGAGLPQFNAITNAANCSPAHSQPELDQKYSYTTNHNGNSRKRSVDYVDSYLTEPAAKRPSYSYASGHARLPQVMTSQSQAPSSSGYPPIPALPMPNLPPPVSQALQNNSIPSNMTPVSNLTPVSAERSTPHQVLPPIQWASGMAMQSALGNGTPQSVQQPQVLTPSRRQHNSYLSHASEGPQYPSQAAHTAPPTNLSPSHFLIQRTSPYRPVRNMSQLLVPPPTGRTQQATHVSHEQMHWQPLGKSQAERRTGRVPYLDRSAWPQAHQAEQWPSSHQMPPQN